MLSCTLFMLNDCFPTDDGDDYSGLPSYLTIPECSNRECVTIEITEDQVVEMNETILVRISQSVNSVSYDRSTATITIYDNDSKRFLFHSQYHQHSSFV